MYTCRNERIPDALRHFEVHMDFGSIFIFSDVPQREFSQGERNAEERVRPGENRISEMMSLRWWKDTRSSRVSAFTMRKLPSFRPTAKALPSGEKQQQRPPAEDNVFVGAPGGRVFSPVRKYTRLLVCFVRRLTFSELAYSQHAVAG